MTYLFISLLIVSVYFFIEVVRYNDGSSQLYIAKLFRKSAPITEPSFKNYDMLKKEREELAKGFAFIFDPAFTIQEGTLKINFKIRGSDGREKLTWHASPELKRILSLALCQKMSEIGSEYDKILKQEMSALSDNLKSQARSILKEIGNDSKKKAKTEKILL